MYSDRINALPPYLFAAIDEAKAEAKAKGVDVIDLGIGDPDLPTHPHIVEAMCEAVRDPRTHSYPSHNGLYEFRKSAADWCEKYKGVKLDPDSEVLALIGSKEAVAHIPLAFVNPGDVVLYTDPGYPVYKIGAEFAGGDPYPLPLKVENDFLPDLDSIPADVLQKAKLFFFNYPNNPTSAVADMAFFEKVAAFCKEHDIIAVHDNAYCQMVYDGYESPSFLAAKGAMDIGIELYSHSKTYNMTGWRVGFAVGNKDLVKGLDKVKSNIDSGTFEAVQLAGAAAMNESQACVDDTNKIYTERRDTLIEGLKAMGLEAKPPKATFYIWAPVPAGFTSMEFSKVLLEEAGIVATPGVGFGDAGEGFIRFALTQPVPRLQEAVERMKKLQF
ncbi:LL-diaminopimelate aminotransferase, methanococcal [Methanosarcina sp. MTP4]|uniref:LL-diaminopimelate aminotransferase n=1 Tax=Methanosarcina sp. MTP4 TaxID=1434100 RepID=UPI0006159F25|nr:LL-diaminopimelate aminotransferase [Methanosarcina sp. MTP4]AKB25402.1 LL-diaminopimelate aminotransferase, methanococcal [Methanosarcina sp. MTP4]